MPSENIESIFKFDWKIGESDMEGFQRDKLIQAICLVSTNKPWREFPVRDASLSDNNEV